MLTLEQIKRVSEVNEFLRVACQNALLHQDDDGFRRASYFIREIQSMWDATRSEANKTRMERKREKRRQRKAARAL